MSAEIVNVTTFNRAESNRMFAAVQAQNKIGAFAHWRKPTPLDDQNIIRLNRDTLYSGAVVDISEGAEIVVPDAGTRYASMMVINQDHYINRVFHGPGVYSLTVEEFDTPYVLIGVRILVDPTDPEDVAAVNVLQDGLEIRSGSNKPFVMPEYDEASFTATRNAVIELARGLDGFAGAFGEKGEVDPIRHLLGTAAGWGGLPESEATYLNFDPGLPVGEYSVTLRDVPVDAFWSISVYNADGFFDAHPRGLNSVNSITADRNADGSITVNFGASGAAKPNYLYVMDGWNYMVRLYQPRPEVLDGSWTFPEISPE